MSIFEDAMASRGQQYDAEILGFVASYRATKEQRKAGAIPEAEFETLRGSEKGKYMFKVRDASINFYELRTATKVKHSKKPLSEADDLALRFGNLDLD